MRPLSLLKIDIPAKAFSISNSNPGKKNPRNLKKPLNQKNAEL